MAVIRIVVSFFALALVASCGAPPDSPTEEVAESAPEVSEVAAPDASAKLVLVAGATGRTGRRVVNQLIDAGFEVRAFVRNEASAREKLGDTIEYAVGDVRDPSSIASAFAGVNMAVSAIGSSGRSQDPTNTPEAVDYEGVKALAAAAVAAELEHFVLVSSMGATVEDHPLNQMFDNVLKWKFRGEEALRESGVPYTIVRPGGLTEEPGGQAPVRIFPEDDGEGMIPRADVAAVCVAALGNPAAFNKTFSVISAEREGPTDWDIGFAGIDAD